MRPKYLSLEQLVLQNKQELLADQHSLNQIEIRLERVKIDLVSNKRKNIRRNSTKSAN